MWETTSVGNLLRHQRSGRYYARYSIGGKRKMVALKTDKISVAKVRLHKKLAEVESKRLSGPRIEAGDATMAALIDRYRTLCEADSTLSPNGKRARSHATTRLERTWPGLGKLRPHAVTREAIVAWANRMHSSAPVKPAPGARARRKGYSANSVNQAADALRRILTLAVESGALHSNPFDSLKGRHARVRKRIALRRVNLPERSLCESVFSEIENPSIHEDVPAPLAAQLRADATDAAELVRGLAYSGMRLGEAGAFAWEDIKADSFMVRGTKTETSAGRIVPIIPPMRALIDRMRERRDANQWAITGPVFRVRECQKTLDRACRAAAVPRLRHHDLRHLFATACIEAGVDIPTVSRWLGHADGGALAMKVYGHLRAEHSISQARKVTFTPPRDLRPDAGPSPQEGSKTESPEKTP